MRRWTSGRGAYARGPRDVSRAMRGARAQCAQRSARPAMRTCSSITTRKCAHPSMQCRSRAGLESHGRKSMSDRIEALRKMLERNPDEPRALFGLAVEHEKRGEWAETASALQRYLAVSDDQGNAWGRLGHALRQLG